MVLKAFLVSMSLDTREALCYLPQGACAVCPLVPALRFRCLLGTMCNLQLCSRPRLCRAAQLEKCFGAWTSLCLLPELICPLCSACSGPREDATRIGSAGVIRRQAVDISPLRRVNQALYLLTTGAREASFRNIKTIAECLADELINAAKGSSNR